MERGEIHGLVHKMARKRTSTIDSLIRDHVTITDGCWLWHGALKEKGYAQCSFEGKNRRVHKLFYEYFKGPVPEGMVLDHLCRVRRCVNPDHVEPVTPKVNSERGFYATKELCIKGHPLSGSNLYRDPSGGRRCRECRKIRDGKLKLVASS